MQIGHIESVASLGNDVLHYACALSSLHAEAESALKCSTMSRHVNLRDEQYMVLAAEINEFASLSQCVILALRALHIGRSIELRILFALQSPRLILGEMPVEGVYLEAAEHSNFSLQLVKRDVAATNIVHKSTYAERRPVSDFAQRQELFAPLVYSQLRHSLACPIESAFGSGLNSYSLRRYENVISLILKYGSINAAHYFFVHGQVSLDILARECIFLRHWQQRRY